MKKYIPLIVASLVAVAAICLYTQEEQPWYGSVTFGAASDLSLEFIVLGDAVYLDRNVDGKPQADELLTKLGSLDVPSKDGQSGYKIESVSVALVSSATSNDSPQVLDLTTVTATDFPYTMGGCVVLSRDRLTAGNCHLFGPLAILKFSTDHYPIEQLFRPDNDAVVKIGLFTIGDNPTTSPLVGPTGAWVNSSLPGDREAYAFDSTVRPELEIVFETMTTQSRQKLTLEEFC